MCRIRRPLRPFDFQLVQVQQSAENKKVPATLQSVEYKCQIINNILKTTLVQTFRSQSNNEFSETQYMFPIQENVCLESFQARYNDKTVKGIVKAKEDAQKEYQSNKSQGNFVSYAETQKNKIDEYIKIMIGNLPPGVSVEIELSFSQQLESILNKYYVAYIPLQFVEDEISAKLGKNVLTLDLFCTGKISYATSKGYPAEKTIVDDNTARFTLSQAFLQKNVDFQLIFSYEGMFDPQVILGSSKVYHEDSVKRNLLPVSNSAMISFIPNFNQEQTQEIDDTIRAAIMNGDDIFSDEFQQKLNQELIDHLNSSRSEFIFLLDRSGSMSGKPIQKAVEALTLFLQSLPNDSYFNVVSFGSGFQKLFPQSQQYNSQTMDKAIAIISKYTADLGGTEIFEPLQDVFKHQQRIQGYNKQIFLLTDGEVSQPENVVNLIKKNNKFNRVHSIGFGSGADKFLIEQSSVAGKGIHKIIELSSDLSEVIINMLSSSITPTYDDFTLSYDQSIFDSTHPKSTNFPCVFKDEIINIHLFFKPLVDIQSLTDAQKVIQIEYYDSQQKEKVKKEIRLEMSDCFTCNSDLQESVFKLGKQLYLNENMESKEGGNELTQQATDFQLMTEQTALICVIESLNDEQKIMFQNINNQNVYSNIMEQDEDIKLGSLKKCKRKQAQIPIVQKQVDQLCFSGKKQLIKSEKQQSGGIFNKILSIFKSEPKKKKSQPSQASLKQHQRNRCVQNERKEMICDDQDVQEDFDEDFNEVGSVQCKNIADGVFQPPQPDISALSQPSQPVLRNQSCMQQETEEECKQSDSRQQLKAETLQSSALTLENLLKLVNSEGVWRYDEKIMRQYANLSNQVINEFTSYFTNKDAFMTIFILCALELFYNSNKTKWVLISKKSTNYVKKNLNQNNEFNTIKQKLISSIQI